MSHRWAGHIAAEHQPVPAAGVSVSTPTKAEVAGNAGADEVIFAEGFRDAVAELTAGRGGRPEYLQQQWAQLLPHLQAGTLIRCWAAPTRWTEPARHCASSTSAVP